MKDNINLKLAIMALALGVLAIFGQPYSGNTVVLNTKELAVIVDNAIDHVTVEDLADWIIQGKRDFRLLDVRDDSQFQEYHIPLAECAPLSILPDYPIDRNEKIILYSDGGIHAAQAWMLLKAKGYRHTYMLLGGLDEWKDTILFPVIPANISPEEEAKYAKLKAVSKFFGGSPQTGEGTVETPEMAPTPMPQVEMPSQTTPVRKKKARKEGC
ncbi:MAG: rhodanese-like domain-containing protein [Gemmatimonadetes bacterium]|nr:MAG: rhodanese-like domain-containing protein [Gemmatimonadota bacterium]